MRSLWKWLPEQDSFYISKTHIRLIQLALFSGFGTEIQKMYTRMYTNMYTKCRRTGRRCYGISGVSFPPLAIAKARRMVVSFSAIARISRSRRSNKGRY